MAQSINGYQSWHALLTQAGTAAPTAVVLFNDLGETLILARSGAGVYTITSPGAKFTAAKTAVILNSWEGSQLIDVNQLGWTRTSTSVITIKGQVPSSHAAADVFTNIFCEIRIYN